MAKTKKRTALDTLYFVNSSNRNVSLEVRTGGPGQTSRMRIELDDTEIVTGHPGHFPETIIGSNKFLQEKTLLINCTITDTSKDTNFTELRIRLDGGIMFMEFPLFASVENDGDSVNYTCLITFFKP